MSMCMSMQAFPGRGFTWSDLILAILCSLLALSATAGPRVVEEQAHIVVPGPDDQIVAGLGFDGDHLMVATRRNFLDEASGQFLAQMFVYVFQRTSSSQWRYVSTLATDASLWEDAITMYVALQGQVAAVQGKDLRVFEYSTAKGWTQTAVLPAPIPERWHSSVIKIDAGTIVSGGTYCAWRAYRKNAAGQWAQAGASSNSESGDCFAELDVSGNTVVAGAGDYTTWSQIRIYPALASAPVTTLTSPFGDDAYFGESTAFDGDTLITSSERRAGLHVFRQRAGAGWEFAGTVASADAVENERDYNIPFVELNGQWVVGAYPFDSQRASWAGSVGVFKRNASGTPSEVARLLASDAHQDLVLGTHVAVSGRRIAAAAGYGAQAQVYVFELPGDLSQPAIVQDDFESGNYSRWTPLAGSTLANVSTHRTRVLRQSSVAGDAGAYLTGIDWKNQSIQADVRATAFQGNDRWFGLVVRRADPQNYYYLTMRSSNAILLRKMVNGQVATLASASLPVTLNRDYRLRLEAVGTWIRAYVDGELLAQARDSTHTHGQAGIQMYRTSAEYDNVVATPNPQLTLLSDDFSYTVERAWSVVDGNWTPQLEEATNTYFYQQQSATGDARAVTGVSTGDQIVEVNARALSFSAANAWIGLMGRYVDRRNYYYVTLRNEGTISLRKLVNGTGTVLGTAALPVTPGTWMTVRLEVVGNALRVYVDNRLMLQARDSTFARGRYGLVTYGAAAEYGEFIARQP